LGRKSLSLYGKSIKVANFSGKETKREKGTTGAWV